MTYKFNKPDSKGLHSILSGTKFLFTAIMVYLLVLSTIDIALAQRPPQPQGPPGGGGGKPGEQLGMSVVERDRDGKASRISFFNVVNANIQDVIKFMSDETNLTIIAGENIQGKKITIVNLKSVTVDEAMEAIKTALNTLGFTTVRVNKTIVIVPTSEAKSRPVRVQIGSDPNLIESSDEIVTQIMPLSYADAAEMSQNLKNLIPKDADMFADTTTNSLVVTDTSANIRRIATILKQLDVEPMEILKMKTFQLKYANAESLAQLLNNMFSQGIETARVFQKLSKRGPDEMMKILDRARQEGKMPGKGIDVIRGQVILVGDSRTNKIIVTASEENLEIIGNLINELDTSEIAQAEIKVFLLNYAIATDVATQLETLLQGSGGRNLPPWERWRARELQTKTKGIQGDVNIVADERLNAVIVSSDPQNFTIIEDIIKQIDQQTAPQEVIHIFPLKYADAETLVQNLQDLFEGEDSRDMPWWERERRRWDRQMRGEKEEITGIQGTVNLVADVRLNAIIVSTAAVNIPILEDLIKKLDITIPDMESDTRIYPLKYADAESIAEILGNIYQQGQSRGGMDRFFWMPRSSRGQQRTGVLTGTITVEAYTRTNSVIVTTTSARNFEVVEKLLEQLDAPTPDDWKYSTFIYPLEYSNADDMQQLLNDIFSEEGGGLSSRTRGGFGSFFRFMMTGRSPVPRDMTTLAGQVRVNADSQTNSLIITTPERNFEAVKEIIRQLDIVRGQVWLDIKVLEVTLGEENKLGLEWMWKEGNHLGKKDLVAEFGTSFQLSDENIGFTYKVFNKNLTALLHTLMRENKVKIISEPSILTRDNQTATLSKGKDIPYLQGTRTDQFGNIVYDYDFLQDVGINIEITPHIAKVKALKEELLFSISYAEFASHLNNKFVSDELRQEFERNRIFLPKNSVITKKDENKWLVNDKTKNYLIRKSDDKLDVYQQEEKRTIGLDIARVNVSSFLEYTDFDAPVTADSTVTTYVDVEDGDTVAIGGMIRTEMKDVQHKFPILGSIPFLGRLFNKTDKVEENTELWILITPHIIDIHSEADREKLREYSNQYNDREFNSEKIQSVK
ncbi:MAG: secretin N-terminal domain-containing protein [bacterium]